MIFLDATQNAGLRVDRDHGSFGRQAIGRQLCILASFLSIWTIIKPFQPSVFGGETILGTIFLSR